MEHAFHFYSFITRQNQSSKKAEPTRSPTGEERYCKSPHKGSVIVAGGEVVHPRVQGEESAVGGADADGGVARELVQPLLDRLQRETRSPKL